MSPCNKMCVCVSINPGRQVSRERSITSALSGTAVPTLVIFSPSITTTTFFRVDPDRESNKFPQRNAIVFAGVDVCPKTKRVPKKKLHPQKATFLFTPPPLLTHH